MRELFKVIKETFKDSDKENTPDADNTTSDNSKRAKRLGDADGVDGNGASSKRQNILGKSSQ